MNIAKMANSLSLVSAVLLLAACEPDGNVVGTGAGASVSACSPLAGSSKKLEGSLDVALAGGDTQFFTLLPDNMVQRRLFQQVGDQWLELKIGGSGIGGGKNKTEVTMSFRTTEDKQAVLGYTIEGRAVTWAGFARTSKDAETKSQLEALPGFVTLESVSNFSLPDASKIQTIGLRKRLRFFAQFQDDKYIVVVNADEKQAAVYVGTAARLSPPQELEVIRFKDGGTVHFAFEYEGAPGRLELPRKIFDFEEESQQKAPKLSLDGQGVAMKNVHDREVATSLIDELTFYGCDRAHPEI